MDAQTSTLAVIYARYSDERLQNESSLDDQISMGRAYAAREDLTVTAVYADPGRTSATIIGRDQLLDMIEQAKAGKFAVVIVESLDRLSRNQEELAYIFNRLSYANVEIRTLNEGTATPMHVGLRGLFGHLFLKDLAQKVRRHQTSRAKEGKIMGGVSYGYRLLDGRPGEREIHPEQAEVVRRIFKEYAQGRNPRQIAAGLNADGLPSPTNSKWSGPSLKRMLDNPLYIGELLWNRYRYARNPDTGKKTRRAVVRPDRVALTVPHLQIIDRALWDAAHGVSKARAVQKFGPAGRVEKVRPGVRLATLLSGKLRCSGCGADMILAARTKTEGHRFMCHNAYRGVGCSQRRTFVRSRLERLVLTGLRERLADERVVKIFIDEYSKGEAERRRRAHSDLSRIRHRLTEIEAAQQRLVKAHIRGSMPEELFDREMGELEGERVVLREQERLAHEENSVVSLHPKALASFRRHIDTLIEDIGKDGVNMEIAQMIRAGIDHVVVKLTEKRAPYEIDLYGDLAPLLTMNPNLPRRTSVQIVEEYGFFDSESRGTSGESLSKKAIYLGSYGERRAA